mmetsp:Transcript_54313/g.115930  ORF Transcript_54313/g.115930 Transcript_54313/m.115930 type:complete len:128 (-) Transcript_54313:98-481(-)
MKFGATIVLLFAAIVALFESPVQGVTVDRHAALRNVNGKLTLDDEPKGVPASSATNISSGNSTVTKAVQAVQAANTTTATKAEAEATNLHESKPGRGGIGGGSGSIQGAQTTFGAALVVAAALVMSA